MKIKAGTVYVFTKSGSWVVAKEFHPATEDSPEFWTVERIDTGKRMLVSPTALRELSKIDTSEMGV